MPQLPPVVKQIPEKIKHLLDENQEAVAVIKAVGRGLRMTHQVEITIVSQDYRTKQWKKDGVVHTLNLTDEENEHLVEGGKVIAAYLCGYRVHIQLPHG